VSYQSDSKRKIRGWNNNELTRILSPPKSRPIKHTKHNKDDKVPVDHKNTLKQ
jgi:hypothetical protein